MNKEIKFRMWIKDRFYYWGFIDGGFRGIPQQNIEIMDIKEMEKRTQQYIGRKDKNDKEIYVGDILKFTYQKVGLIGVVEYGFCSFYINSKIHYLIYDIDIENIEVIGNIYEKENKEKIKP